jgi:peroxiredoxin
MPDLRDVYEQNKEKGLVILAINVQESARQAQGFAELYRLTFPIALDETGAVSTAYRVSGLPTTYLIDRQGIIRDRVIGQMSKAMMVALFERTR